MGDGHSPPSGHQKRLGVGIGSLLLSKGRDDIDKAPVVLDATLSAASLLLLLLLLVNLDSDRRATLKGQHPKQCQRWRIMLRNDVWPTLGVCPLTFPARAREPWTLPEEEWMEKRYRCKSKTFSVTILGLYGMMGFCYNAFAWVLEVTSEKPANDFQGTVFWNTTGCQGGTILQRAPSEQQHLVLR